MPSPCISLFSSLVVLIFLLTADKVEGACDVNSTIFSFREDVPPGTVIMRIPRETGEKWAFREDGPPGYIELRAYQHSVVFYFAETPDLERLNNGTSLVQESLPFTLECTYNGWKYVFKQEIVLLDVNDNDPEFDPERPSSITISENTSPGTTVLELDGFARDPDVTGRVTTYNITPHADSLNDGYAYFGVSGSGLILKQAVDYDHLRQIGRSFYVLNITAIDNGFPVARRSHTSLMVNVTDSDDQGPAFVYADCPMLDGFCTTPLYETVAKKSFKGPLKIWPSQIRATDMDSINNTIYYYIVKVSPEEFRQHFTMNKVTGEVTVTKPFQRDDIDAILVTIKAEEKSPARRFVTTTLRVQVVGDYYANYKDNVRQVPVNEAAETHVSTSESTTSVPIAFFVATIAVFFIVVISFPFIFMKIVKGKLLKEPARVSSLQLRNDDGSSDGRKESSDTTTTSILTCTSTDTGCTVYGPPHHSDDSSVCSSSSSSSSSSTPNSPSNSVRMNFADDISIVPITEARSRISSVSFDPEEVSSRFSPPMPIRCKESATARFKRRLSDLLTAHTSSQNNKKARVRFDIRNVSDFS